MGGTTVDNADNKKIPKKRMQRWYESGEEDDYEGYNVFACPTCGGYQAELDVDKCPECGQVLAPIIEGEELEEWIENDIPRIER